MIRGSSGLALWSLLFGAIGANYTTAWADTKNWIGGTSDQWVHGGNWDPQGAPGSADSAVIAIPSASVSLVGASVDVASLTLDATLKMGGAAGDSLLFIKGDQTVGSTGSGVFEVNKELGKASLGQMYNLTLGSLAGSDGTLQLAGTLDVGQVIGVFQGGDVVVGSRGRGLVNQTGYINVRRDLKVGEFTNTVHSIYNYNRPQVPGLASFGMAVVNNMEIGLGGSGEFNHIDGTVVVGDGQIEGGVLGNLFVGGKRTVPGEQPSVGTGYYFMNKGRLVVKGSIVINRGESDGVQSYFIQNGDSEVEIGSSLDIGRGIFQEGQNRRFAGYYEMKGGTLIIRNDLVAFGRFHQTGGTTMVNGKLKLYVDWLAPQVVVDIAGGTFWTTKTTEIDTATDVSLQVSDTGVWRIGGDGKIVKKGNKAKVKVDAGGTIEFIGTQTQEIDGVDFENSGTMALLSDSEVFGTNAPVLKNFGLLELRSDAGISGSGSLINSGELRKSSGTETSKIEFGISDGGTVNVQTGHLELAGPVSVTSGMSKSGTGVLDITGPQSHSLNSTLTVGQGTLNLNTDAGAGGGRVLTVTVTPSSQGYSALANFNAPQQLAGLAAYLGGEVVLAEGGQAPLTVDGLNLTAVGETDPTGRLEVNDNTVTAWGGAAYALGNYYAWGDDHGWQGVGITSAVAVNEGRDLHIAWDPNVNPQWASVSLGNPGDGNHDGLVDGSDYGLDVNRDGVVDATDTAIVDRHLGSLDEDLHLHSGELANRVGGPRKLTLDGSAGKTLSGHGFEVAGILALVGSGDVTLSSGASVNNSGLFDVQRDGNVLAGTGALVNSGVLRKSGGNGVSLIDSGIGFSNPSGTIDVQTGAIRVTNWLHVQSGQSMTKTGAGVLDLPGGMLVNGSAAMGAGTMSVGSVAYTSLEVGSTGTLDLSGGTLQTVWSSVHGTLLQTGGVHQANGSFTLVHAGNGNALYRIEDGELHANSLSIGIGNEGGRFEQTGGTVSMTSLRLIDGAWGTGTCTASYTMSGGTAGVSGASWVAGSTGGTATLSISGGSMSFNGALNIAPSGGSGTVSVSGGSLSVAGSTVNAGTINVSGGSVSLQNLSGSGSLAVSGSGGVTVNHVRQQSLTASGAALLTVRESNGGGDVAGADSATSVVRSLSMSESAKLDLANNHLVLDWSGGSNQAAAVRALITSGRNGGTWDGAGIGSSTAAAMSNLRGVGYADNTLLGAGTFGGQSVPSDSVLVRYTLLGDTDLNAAVNFYDWTALTANYGSSNATWQMGDSDYDGNVNFFDLTALNANYGQSLPTGGEGLLGGGASMSSDGGLADYVLDPALLAELREKVAAMEPERLGEFDAMIWPTGGVEALGAAPLAAFASVPEPSAALLLAAAGIALAARRRRG